MSALLTPRQDVYVDQPAGRRPFSRIVVAVDQSAAADRALQLALSIARGDFCAEAIFVHVIDLQRLFSPVDRYGDDYDNQLPAAREEAVSLLDRCVMLARARGVPALGFVRYGRPAAQIANIAKRYDANLVVIGNSRRSRLHRALNGSVRDRVVRSNGVAVLVAGADPAGSPELGAGPVLVQSTAGEAAPAWSTACRLALAYDRPLVDAGAGADDAERAIAENDAALLVLGAPRRPRSPFRSDVLERTLQAATVPVLVVRDVL